MPNIVSNFKIAVKEIISGKISNKLIKNLSCEDLTATHRLGETEHKFEVNLLGLAIIQKKMDIYRLLLNRIEQLKEDFNRLHEQVEHPYNCGVIAAIKINNFKLAFNLLDKLTDFSVLNRAGNSIIALSLGLANEDMEEIKSEIISLINNKHLDINQDHDRCERPLIIACFEGDAEIVNALLLREDLDVNCFSKQGHTPLYVSCFKGDNQVTKLLFKHPAIDINKTSNGFTALAIACEKGHRETVQLLLEQKGINVNKVLDMGVTSLMLAIEEGHLEIVKTLLQHPELDINLYDENFNTALSLACANGHKEIVALLLQHDANINVVNAQGLTALFIACHNGYQDIVLMLLQHAVDIDAANNLGITTLMIACQNGYKEIVAMLLKKSVNLNAASNTGVTALMLACQNGHNEIVEMLLAHPVDINAASLDGGTALMRASRNGYPVIVELLLKHPVNVKAITNDSYTALSLSCQNGHNEIVKMLLEHPVDINVASSDGMTALMLACENGFKEIVEMLIQHPIEINACRNDGATCLIIATGFEQTEIVALLLRHKSTDINKTTSYGYTPFHIACAFDNRPLVELFLSTSHFNIYQAADNRLTPLDIACMDGNFEIAKLIIQRYVADLKKTERDSTSNFSIPTDYLIHGFLSAIISDQIDIIQYICQEHNELISYADTEGNLALQFAIKNQNLKLIATLLDAGADVNQVGKSNKTALHLAVAYLDDESSLKRIIQSAKPETRARVDDKANTFLHTAAAANAYSFVKTFDKEITPIVNAQNDRGETALFIALKKNAIAFALQLIINKKLDTNLNLANHEGITPLDITIRSNNFSFACILINNGADCLAVLGNLNPELQIKTLKEIIPKISQPILDTISEALSLCIETLPSTKQKQELVDLLLARVSSRARDSLTLQMKYIETATPQPKLGSASPGVITNSGVSLFNQKSQAVSGRKYLLEQQYDPETIREFKKPAKEEESAAPISPTKTNLTWGMIDPENTEEVFFLDSEMPRVLNVRNNKNLTNLRFYCPPDLIPADFKDVFGFDEEHKQVKLAGKFGQEGIKDIHQAKLGTVTIRIGNKTYANCPIDYEYKVKDKKQALTRLLVAAIVSDQGRGTLYVAFHFTEKGLHEPYQLDALRNSFAANKDKVITITLPPEIESKRPRLAR